MRHLLALSIALAVGTAPLHAEQIAVTVYNSNLGVVSEVRRLTFEKGVGKLSFIDVPTQIDPASVRFELAGGGTGVQILDQNYAYDLVSSEQILARHIDRYITMTDEKGSLFGGKLLASDGGRITLLDTLSGQLRLISTGKMVELQFPKLLEGLITRPTLFWLYQSTSAGQKDARVSYQTSGLNWEAEYVGVLDKGEKQLDLSGWASITNNSGKTFTDARLKLVAGTINRAPKGQRNPAAAVRMMAAEDMSATSFQEKSFFEYHLYTLPRPATLANNELKQLSLFSPAETGIKKIYRYRPQVNETDVDVAVQFTNAKSSGLGMPLPAGRIRMFKADDDGSLILLGEDRINHTPTDEQLTLSIGTAFDIKVEEKMTRQTRVSDRVEDQSWEIELRNRKTEAITVNVERVVYGFWEIRNSSHPYKTKDAQTMTFEIPLAAGQVETVKIDLRLTYR